MTIPVKKPYNHTLPGKMNLAYTVDASCIVHVKSSPYHPSTNGLAERAVQTFKAGIKKLIDSTLESKLSHFLFCYRLTPQTTTGQSPAELLLGRRIKS